MREGNILIAVLSHVLAVSVGGALGEYTGRDKTARTFGENACQLACELHKAGDRHTVDETFCVCSSGAVFRRDRARLYVPIKGNP